VVDVSGSSGRKDRGIERTDAVLVLVSVLIMVVTAEAFVPFLDNDLRSVEACLTTVRPGQP
jgi:hypothetical protein